MRLLRKISVGPDFKNAMHYEVGGLVINRQVEITNLIEETDGSVSMYVSYNGETQIWKNFRDMPIVKEYMIDLL